MWLKQKPWRRLRKAIILPTTLWTSLLAGNVRIFFYCHYSYAGLYTGLTLILGYVIKFYISWGGWGARDDFYGLIFDKQLFYKYFWCPYCWSSSSNHSGQQGAVSCRNSGLRGRACDYHVVTFSLQPCGYHMFGFRCYLCGAGIHVHCHKEHQGAASSLVLTGDQTFFFWPLPSWNLKLVSVNSL